MAGNGNQARVPDEPAIGCPDKTQEAAHLEIDRFEQSRRARLQHAASHRHANRMDDNPHRPVQMFRDGRYSTVARKVCGTGPDAG